MPLLKNNNWLYKSFIHDVKDFPKPGITFKDIQPLLANPTIFDSAIKEMSNLVQKPDYWVGIDSRGFIMASSLSTNTGIGLKLIRKKGKLPPPVTSISYDLEYGSDTIELQPGKGNVVIIDDVYATGGTMNAAEKLCKEAGYNVIDKLVLIDLCFLHPTANVKSLIKYE
jgi:adenine phosphoribosyltransferase